MALYRLILLICHSESTHSLTHLLTPSLHSAQLWQRTHLHAGFRPRLACQFWSHVSSFLALLLSPCWPMICRMFVGLYLSTHNKDSNDEPSEPAETSGLCVSCDAWLSWVNGVTVMLRPLTLPWDRGVTSAWSNTHVRHQNFTWLQWYFMIWYKVLSG